MVAMAGFNNLLESIPIFKGNDGNHSFAEWVSTCKSLFLALGVENEIQCVHLLLNRMEGQAKVEAQAYKRKTQTINQEHPRCEIQNIDDFQTYFGPIFTVKGRGQLIRSKLNTLKQKGSIETYIQEETNILGDYQDMSDQERIYLFRQGLNPELSRLILRNDPTTFEETIRICLKRETENILQQTDTQWNLSEDKMEIDALLCQCKELTENHNNPHQPIHTEPPTDWLNAMQTHRNTTAPQQYNGPPFQSRWPTEPNQMQGPPRSRNPYQSSHYPRNNQTIQVNINGTMVPIDRFSPEGQQFLMSYKGCYNCGRRGHQAFQCRSGKGQYHA